MKKMITLILATVMVFTATAALARTVEPEDADIERFAGKTFHATVGEYDDESATFTVTVYDCDRYDDDDVRNIAVGDILLAGGRLYKVNGQTTIEDTVIYLCDGGEEIYFEKAYDDDDDIIARSTSDDRIFMKAIAVLHLPAAEGIVYEDNSDPDLDAKMIVKEGLVDVLNAQIEKEENSIGFHFYSTTVTLNENLEITRIHQDYDVAQ